MSWAEIKHAVNNTIGSANSKALNVITEDQKNELEYRITETLMLLLGNGNNYVSIANGEGGYITTSDFTGNTTVKKIIISNSVFEIDMDAFSGCSALESVSIPNSVKEIGNGAFALCVNLQKVELPFGLKTIANQLFDSCTSLSYVHIPETVEEIESGAFSNCENLTKIRIPKSVTSIESDAFSGCDYLEDIYVGFSSGAVSGAPWGATNATIHYNS